jgi:hypothetical protein
VQLLASLDPEVAVTGHGPTMRGQRLRMALHWLADHFDEIGMPADGRYVRSPAVTAFNGAVVRVPPAVPDPLPKLLLAGAVMGGVAYGVARMMRKEEARRGTFW